MSEAAASAYAQLLSVGLVWISFHCAGMCGPILIGFDVAGASRGHSVPRGALSILQYQAGRIITYSLFGAVAGLAGVGLDAVFGPAGAIFALAFGVTILVTAFWRRRPRPVVKTTLEQRFEKKSWVERLTQALPRMLHPLAVSSGPGRPFLLGAVMGLLPCMITFWALGLAATTGSPLHGAGVMVLLVLMTTPMLLGVTLLPRVFKRLNAGRVQRVLLTVSGVWLTLVGLAGLDVVAHVHIPVALFGERYVIMLW
ncbi:MAG: sulfite exporter TauE/SafE family protein [Deltaproteobacteria bacterium]|nr:MAG: sulfite exporter TauE/SafE family protein [Deltaproteobacteria bacterium]